MTYFEPITINTRVGRSGRLLRCPHCKHVNRAYSLSWSKLACVHCGEWTGKYHGWTIGPAVTPEQLRPSRRYKAQRGTLSVYGKTKKELFKRLVHPIREYKIMKETLPGWTRPDYVLVISRRLDKTVEHFSDSCLPESQSLSWCDSSGTRSVFLYKVDGEQEDLPLRTFQLFKDFLAEREIEPDLIMHREDPGLGIYLPEIDEVLEGLG